MESYARIATLASELKAGIVPFTQHYMPQDEQSYTTIVSCKWAHRGNVESGHPDANETSCFI